MTLTNAGNVGIGTPSPRKMLEVSGAAGQNSIQSQDGGSDFLRIYADSAFGSAINVNTGGVIRFAHSDEGFTNFAERMRIDNSGNVGIGTSSPNARLDTRGSQIIQPRLDSGKLIKSVFSAATPVTAELINANLNSDNRNMIVIVDVTTSRSSGEGAGIVRYMTGIRRNSGIITPYSITEISSATLNGTNPKATLSWNISGDNATLIANNNAQYCATMYEVSAAVYSDGGGAPLTFVG
jgi:hypothetical protein